MPPAKRQGGPREREIGVGRVDHIVPVQFAAEAGVSGRQIRMIRIAAQKRQARRAEDRPVHDVAHIRGDFLAARARTGEMNGEVEPVGKPRRGLCESFPTLHMAARFRAALEVDQHPYAKGTLIHNGFRHAL